MSHFLLGFMDELMKLGQVDFAATAAGRMQASNRGLQQVQGQMKPGGMLNPAPPLGNKPITNAPPPVGMPSPANSPAPIGSATPAATPAQTMPSAMPGARLGIPPAKPPRAGAGYDPFGPQTAKSVGIPE